MVQSSRTWQQTEDSRTGSTSSEFVGQAQEKVGDAASQARDKAQEAAGRARGRLQQEVDTRSTQAGDQINSTVGDLRSVAEELRNKGQETPAKLAEQVAGRAEQVGNYLRESDAEGILNDIEDFARRQPWAVMAGGVALGLVASRFLKASSRDRYDARGLATHGYTTTRSDLDAPLGGTYGLRETGADRGLSASDAVVDTDPLSYEPRPRPDVYDETAEVDVYEPGSGTEPYEPPTGADPLEPRRSTQP